MTYEQKAMAILLALPQKYRKYKQESSTLHPIRIAKNCHTDEERAIALLHDALEDYGSSLIKIIKPLFPSSILQDIFSLTHLENETYPEYVHRLCKSQRAQKIKFYDIMDNLHSATPKNRIKYANALEIIEFNPNF